MDYRTLTDADVNAIVSGLEDRLIQKFYRDVGRGVWGFVWKAMLLLLLAAAAFGAKGGFGR